MAKRVKRRHRVVAACLREQDVAEMDRIAEALRSVGWDYSNRSFVIRAALVFLSDAIRGKPPEEILRLFAERRARVPPRPESTPG